MKSLIKIFKEDKLIFWSLLISSLFFCLSLILCMLFYNQLSPYIPLYNQMPWGEARLGTKTDIFIPVLILLGVFVLNFILAEIYYKKMPLISRLLFITFLLISFLTFIFIIRTIKIVI